MNVRVVATSKGLKTPTNSSARARYSVLKSTVTYMSHAVPSTGKKNSRVVEIVSRIMRKT